MADLEQLESEQLYRTMMRDLSTFAIFSVAADGRIQTWNKGVERLLGYSEAEFIRLCLGDLCTAEDRQVNRAASELQRARLLGQVTECQSLLRKDGIKVLFDVTVNPVAVADGEPASFSKVIREPSAEMRNERALQFANSIIDTVRESVLILDHQLRIIGANRSFYRTFHVNPVETEGRFLYEIGNGQWDIPALRNLLEKIVPQNCTVDDYEVRHDFPDIGLKHILLNARLLDQDTLLPGRILLAFEDVTSRHNAERELWRTKGWLQATLRSIGDGVVTTDASGRVLSLNPVAEALTGWTQEQAKGAPLPDVFRIVQEDTGEPVANPALRALAEGRSMGLATHTVLLHKTGGGASIDDSAAPIRDADGSILGSVLIFRDISEKRGLEQDREKLLEQQSALLASTSEGIYTIDPAGRCTLINDAACRLLGFSSDDCLGKNMHRLIHYHGPDGSDYPDEDCTILASAIQGKHVRDDAGVFWRKDGAALPVGFSSSPIMLNRELVGAVISFSDQSERRRLEAERENLAERLRLALEAARMITWTWKPDDHSVSISPNFPDIYGLSSLDSPDALLSLVVAADRESHLAIVQSAVRSGAGYQSEFRIRRPDTGAVVWLYERAVSTGNGPGASPTLTGITVDITERRQFQQELENAHLLLEGKARELKRSNNDLGQFAAIAGHDLQSPLRTMTSYAQLLVRRYESSLDENARQYLDFITGAARSMQNLISALLEYAQVGGSTRPREWVSLGDLIAPLRSLLLSPAEESRALLTSAQLPTVCGDPLQLKQLFQNLISNALKYRDPQRTPDILITATAGETHWRVSVRDNGIGIPPDYLESIFRPLNRLHGAEIDGTGLGLSICKRTVENHGGVIWAESETGIGSTFSFTLARFVSPE